MQSMTKITIHPMITTLRRAVRMCRETFAKPRKTNYLKGLWSLAKKYGGYRGAVKDIPLDEFPAIQKALGGIKIGFSVRNYTNTLVPSSLIRRAIKASIKELATFGMPGSKKRGSITAVSLYEQPLVCDLSIIPEGKRKAKLRFDIFQMRTI